MKKIKIIAIVILIISLILGFFLFRSKISMTHKRQRIIITITGCPTIYEIGKILDSHNIVAYSKFLRGLNEDYTHEYEFLNPKAKQSKLSGYLLPDTYEFFTSEDPKKVIRKFLTNFDNKVYKKIKLEIEDKNYILHDYLIMASILAKEAKNIDDAKIISGIFWERLKMGIPLQADAINIFSDFDSYKNKGLPPDPLCNPETGYILASIYPKKTNYLFFFYNSKNKLILSKTLLEHTINLEINK